jgi:hypothetical protein
MRSSFLYPLRSSFSTRTSMTVSSAMKMLGLSASDRISSKVLKDAYFQRAKECHPDSNHKFNSVEDATSHFVRLTDAYEFLTNCSVSNSAEDLGINNIIPISEEEDYRRACMSSLGLTAEAVEESKRCPLFRQWLRGRSDSAAYWNSFLMLHGGLAPRLPMRKSLSYDYDTLCTDSVVRRRRRRGP